MKERLLETVDYLKAKGAEYADVRLVRTDTESLKARDGSVEAIVRELSQGVGIRCIAGGAWGFAASSTLSAAALRRTANRALQIAKASALTRKEEAQLSETEIYRDSYRTPFEIDPFEVRLNRKVDLLLKINRVLKKKKLVRTAESSMAFYKIHKLFLSTEGAAIEQDLLESGAGYVATATDGEDVQRRSFPSSLGGDFGAGGYELVERMGLLENAERVREEAIALLKAPPMPAGEYDIIIEGSQMALQVHESCGHPIELDRVLGTEISLAGGSFLTLDKLGSFRYGSQIVNIDADATIPGALGTFGYDDEGVKAQAVPIVKEGIFVGYLSSRETARVIGQRSNGAMRADGWQSLPLIRMTNINLRPGTVSLEALTADTEGGFILDTNKSWSIDDKRLNFQFGLEAAWKIEQGRRGRMYKNPLYTGMTPRFWASCDAICNRDHWHVWGVPNCGKGDPMQAAHVAHGTSPARFRKVEVGVSK